MIWGDFAEAAPELAALGRQRFEKAGVAFIGTIRKDGSPRISPLETMILEDRLLLGMMWQSRKALDLLRDPRCVLHSAVCNRDGSEGEFKAWGLAVDMQDKAFRKGYEEACDKKISWHPPEPYHVFSLEVERASYLIIENMSQRVIRWREGGQVETQTRRWMGSGYVDD